MVTSEGYLLYQRENQIIINLPQTWETITDSGLPIVDRLPFLSLEQEQHLLAAAIRFLKNGV